MRDFVGDQNDTIVAVMEDGKDNISGGEMMQLLELQNSTGERIERVIKI